MREDDEAPWRRIFRKLVVGASEEQLAYMAALIDIERPKARLRAITSRPPSSWTIEDNAFVWAHTHEAGDREAGGDA